MTEKPKEPELLAEIEKGNQKIPGYAAAAIRARVYRLSSGKFRLSLEEFGLDEHIVHGQESLEPRPQKKLELRHVDLDQLMAIALAEEKEKDVRAAIREAIYAAQDAIEA